MKPSLPLLSALLCALLSAGGASAQSHAQNHAHGHGSQPAAAPRAQAQPRPEVEALVRTVDKSARKITLKHGDIPNLDMGPMTMVFHVADPALLDKVKPGDTVRFTADKIRGAYTVLTIEPVRQ